MKAKEYNLIYRCVEDGVSLGHMRAYKHNDKPPPDSINTAIVDAIMNELCEWFDFDEAAE